MRPRPTRRWCATSAPTWCIRRGPDIAARVRELEPDGVDAVADGSVQNAQLFDAVRDGGGFATVRGFKADAPRGITIHQVWVREYATEQAKLDRLRQQVEDGRGQPAGGAHVPAGRRAPRHIACWRPGGTRGRLVIEL